MKKQQKKFKLTFFNFSLSSFESFYLIFNYNKTAIFKETSNYFELLICARNIFS